MRLFLSQFNLRCMDIDELEANVRAATAALKAGEALLDPLRKSLVQAECALEAANETKKARDLGRRVMTMNKTDDPVCVADYTDNDLFGEDRVPPVTVTAITFDVDIFGSFEVTGVDEREFRNWDIRYEIRCDTIDPAYSVYVDELKDAVESVELSKRTMKALYNTCDMKFRDSYDYDDRGESGWWKVTRTWRAFVPVESLEDSEDEECVDVS